MNQTEQDRFWLGKAIELSRQGMESGQGGPFGCIIVRNGKIVGQGNNQVTTSNDPTAHAEVVAIRDACRHLGNYQLSGCDVYTSCEPCPMCLGAIYWARPNRVVFANTREEAAAIEFDDDFIYHEINTNLQDRKIPFIHLPDPKAKEIFDFWKNWEGKIKY
jgi:tRNA(Arg) A34 adenosine deaminase TadA